MGRHEFEPGKLVAGLALLAGGLIFALDATGAWSVPAWVLIPVVVGGLSLAGATGVVRSAIRRGSERRRGGDRNRDRGWGEDWDGRGGDGAGRGSGAGAPRNGPAE